MTHKPFLFVYLHCRFDVCIYIDVVFFMIIEDSFQTFFYTISIMQYCLKVHRLPVLGSSTRITNLSGTSTKLKKEKDIKIKQAND